MREVCLGGGGGWRYRDVDRNFQMLSSVQGWQLTRPVPGFLATSALARTHTDLDDVGDQGHGLLTPALGQAGKMKSSCSVSKRPTQGQCDSRHGIGSTWLHVLGIRAKDSAEQSCLNCEVDTRQALGTAALQAARAVSTHCSTAAWWPGVVLTWRRWPGMTCALCTLCIYSPWDQTWPRTSVSRIAFMLVQWALGQDWALVTATQPPAQHRQLSLLGSSAPGPTNPHLTAPHTAEQGATHPNCNAQWS